MPPQTRTAPGGSLKADLAALRSRPTEGDPNAPIDLTQGQDGTFAAPPQGSIIEELMKALEGTATGAAKGAGQTAFNLGNAVHSIPGVGSITDSLSRMVGPEGTNPDAAFSQTPDDLQAKTGPESFGKTAEQIAEFFLPGGAARRAASGQAAKLIPEAMSYAKNPAIFNIAHLLSSILGEAGTSAGVSALHGANPDVPAGMAAAGPALGEGVASVAPVIGVPLVQQLAGVTAGAMAGHAVGGTLGGGLGGALALQPGVRALVRRLMGNPQAIATVQSLARRGVPTAMRLAAAIQSEFQGSTGEAPPTR